MLGTHIDLFFKGPIVFESLRQWAILLTCFTLLIFLWVATLRVFKTNRTLTFDCFIIGAESVSVILVLIFEFAYDNLIMLLSMYILETLLRSIVCSNFVSKVLLLKGTSENKIKLFKIVYYIFIGGVVGGTFALALISSTALNCYENNNMYSWHWFIIDGVDLVQSILITISACYLIDFMKKKIQNEKNPKDQKYYSAVRISANPNNSNQFDLHKNRSFEYNQQHISSRSSLPPNLLLLDDNNSLKNI